MILRPCDLAPRRGFRRTEAAAYLGVSPSKFSALIADGRVPAGFAIDGCVVWDVRDLDDAFERLKDGNRQPELVRL